MIDNFTLEIETRAAANGSYIETITELCHEKNLCEYELADMLHDVIKDKLKEEFIRKNYIPKLKNHTSLESFFD
jgi:hypothetical protein